MTPLHVDRLLGQARFQTLVHGDAKHDNFCLAARANGAAAVDFQYVGRGPGIKDVAYFLASCLTPSGLGARRSRARPLRRVLDRTSARDPRARRHQRLRSALILSFDSVAREPRLGPLCGP